MNWKQWYYSTLVRTHTVHTVRTVGYLKNCAKTEKSWFNTSIFINVESPFPWLRILLRHFEQIVWWIFNTVIVTVLLFYWVNSIKITILSIWKQCTKFIQFKFKMLMYGKIFVWNLNFADKSSNWLIFLHAITYYYGKHFFFFCDLSLLQI